MVLPSTSRQDISPLKYEPGAHSNEVTKVDQNSITKLKAQAISCNHSLRDSMYSYVIESCLVWKIISKKVLQELQDKIFSLSNLRCESNNVVTKVDQNALWNYKHSQFPLTEHRYVISYMYRIMSWVKDNQQKGYLNWSQINYSCTECQSVF